MWYGRNRYHTTPPQGSVLPTALRIWRYAQRGRWSLNPFKTIKNLKSEDFWESAKPSNVVGEKPRWMTFDDQWVDEVRRGFKACGVFAWFPLYCGFSLLDSLSFEINFATQGSATTNLTIIWSHKLQQ